MKPLKYWPLVARQRITGVFTDIDDTLTTDGAITPDALAALGALRNAGLHVLAITGRPVGWSASFAIDWPVDAIVVENGAVLLQKQPEPAFCMPGVLLKTYFQDMPTRCINHARMQQVAARVLREVPGTQLAQDSAGRETDIAIDHNEFAKLPQCHIDKVVSIMRAEGMQASVSSIHINGWYGSHNKLVGARWAVAELYGRDLDTERDRWAFVGDSTNDQLMFEAFANSIGVANIARFLPQLKSPPQYVTPGERGAGFAQAAALLLSPR